MRIKYTLPGLQLGRTPGSGSFESVNTSFKSRLQRVIEAEIIDWKEVLRLDRSLSDAGTIGPPPKPATFEMNDAASERLRWRNLINRDWRSVDIRINAMLELLLEYQAMEDSIIARHLAETRG